MLDTRAPRSARDGAAPPAAYLIATGIRYSPAKCRNRSRVHGHRHSGSMNSFGSRESRPRSVPISRLQPDRKAGSRMRQEEQRIDCGVFWDEQPFSVGRQPT